MSPEHRIPVIGVSTYREPASWGVWRQRADLLPAEYADAVAAVGAAPVLLAPVDPALAPAVLARLDALVVSGGADVDPARYGVEAGADTDAPRTDRDAWELALLTAADELGLPVLGICRGMQLMAVHAGGALFQHVPDVVGHVRHSPGGDDGREFGTTAVATVAGSRVAALVGERVDGACHHHQSVRTHPGFAASAHAADGTVEAMERPGGRFCVAVQWHPETATDVGLLAGLVAAARPR